MNGNELYERFSMVLSNTIRANSPPWHSLSLIQQQVWAEVATQVTTTIAQADPVYPVTDDEIMSWIEAQKPNVLARLYQILHSMGYRI